MLQQRLHFLQYARAIGSASPPPLVAPLFLKPRTSGEMADDTQFFSALQGRPCFRTIRRLPIGSTWDAALWRTLRHCSSAIFSKGSLRSPGSTRRLARQHVGPLL